MKSHLKTICLLVYLVLPFTVFSHQGTVKISVKHHYTPVLKELEYNPIMRIKIESEGDLKLKSLSLNLSGTTELKEIKSFGLYYSGKDSVFRKNWPMAKLSEIDSSIEFILKQKLDSKESYLWVSCELQEHANLLSRLFVKLQDVSFGRKTKVEIFQEKHQVPFRYGLALRRHGQDGVHTYRIPGLATSNKGTLLAVYDARRESSRDLQGDIDIGLNRSFDGGSTWEPMQIIMDMGEWGGLFQKFNGVSDASILVNGSDIYVAALWMHGVLDKNGKWIEGLTNESNDWNHQWRNNGSQPGFGEKQSSQFLIVKSADDGNTWSKPINLTKMCKKKEWWLWAPAPGRGIVMEDGTLVFPTQGRDKNGLPFSNITFSKDNGITWETGNPASHNTTENSVVEYEKGKLMLNIRDNRNRQDKSESNGRAVFTTSDIGNIWIEHSTSHGALIEPVCMASLHKHAYMKNGSKNEVLLFSNPNSKHHRENLTIKMSFDGGKTWPKNSWILLDEGRGRGYSCLTSIDGRTIGIVYEGSRSDMVFQKIDITDYLHSK